MLELIPVVGSQPCSWVRYKPGAGLPFNNYISLVNKTKLLFVRPSLRASPPLGDIIPNHAIGGQLAQSRYMTVNQPNVAPMTSRLPV